MRMMIMRSASGTTLSGYQGGRRSPVGIGGAIAVHAVAVGAILLMPKEMIEPFVPTIMVGTNVPLDPPPPEAVPPKTEEMKPTRPAIERATAPDTIVPLRGFDDILTGTDGPSQGDTGAKGGGIITPADPPALPVFVDAAIDPKALSSFQPDYPGMMIRQGIEGSVKVRVTIGANGRVTDIERLTASDDAFWLATQRHAWRKWRFVPATRDGVAVPSSKILTVHFRLRDN